MMCDIKYVVDMHTCKYHKTVCIDVILVAITFYFLRVLNFTWKICFYFDVMIYVIAYFLFFCLFELSLQVNIKTTHRKIGKNQPTIVTMAKITKSFFSLLQGTVVLQRHIFEVCCI
jgi:hypothetical protein